MKTRLYNAKILSMREGEEIFDGEIVIEEGRIVRLTPAPSLDTSLERGE